MKIPKSFKLLGREFKIEYSTTLNHDAGRVGELDFKRGIITLHEPNGFSDKSYIEQTFCHELVHALFYSIAEDELAQNEKVVDALGGVLHQALETMK